jgi:long-chain acyl-CoA synthetase
MWISAPSRTSGYWNDPQATEEVFRDGWFDTGDVTKADSDGYLWFCGRQKQIIVHDGSNISPQKVEDALLEYPADVRAYVELKNDVLPPKAGDLIQFARARIGYKAPEEIVFLDAMPLNPTGKVDCAALKKLAAGDHAHHI